MGSTTATEWRIPVPVPLDLRGTLRPLGGVFYDDGWWRAARTPAGPATLHLCRDRSGVISRAWGSGADWLVARTPALIGLEDAPESLVTDHPLVRELCRRNRGLRFGATGLVIEALVKAVVEQKVAGREAARSMAGLLARMSDTAPGPRHLRLPPDPERLAAAPYWDYHDIGIEKRRADTLRRVAADSERIAGLAALDPDAARRRLHGYPGVGAWSSAETVAVSHGDADAVSVGDFHLKNIVAWHLSGRPRGTDEEMLELLEPFRPHRARVVRLLVSLGHAPAFGPRVALRSFSGS